MRQAVVIIHGIGEQWPMETLRGFVKAVLKSMPHADHFYSKPDRISDTLELRRLAVNNTGEDPIKLTNPTDFYELYWQHLMIGTTFEHLRAWLGKLLLRSPGSVPPRLRPAWWLMWALMPTILGLSVYTIGLGRRAVVGGIGVVLLLYLARHLIGPLLKYFSLKYVGDAARYLSAFPENVSIRHAIRSAGLDLLRGLHQDRRYERIIVVGHSLGSVIAYDVLTYLWQEMHSKVERSTQKHGRPELEELHHRSESKSPPYQIKQPKLDAVLQWTKRNPPTDESEQLESNCQYRKCQRELRDEYRELWKDYSHKYKKQELEFRFPWRITDLVTLGSPLTYAEYLLAKKPGEFCERKRQREFPTCPPRREDPRDDEMRKEDGGLLQRVHPVEAPELSIRIPHHAALFACTHWTNLYFPGDIIGGPLAYLPDPSNPAKRIELFGLGVQDVELHGYSAHRRVSHVKYWAEEEEEALDALRAALALEEDISKASEPN
jgi:hypothetical protein